MNYVLAKVMVHWYWSHAIVHDYATCEIISRAWFYNNLLSMQLKQQTMDSTLQ